MRPLISKQSLVETADKLKRQLAYMCKDELPADMEKPRPQPADDPDAPLESSRVREDEEYYSNAMLQ